MSATNAAAVTLEYDISDNLKNGSYFPEFKEIWNQCMISAIQVEYRPKIMPNLVANMV